MKTIASSLPLIRENSVHRFGISMMSGSIKELELHLAKLHPKELEIYSTFKHEQRKTSYLLGRLSAKNAIFELTNFNQFNTVFINTAIFEFPVVECRSIQNIQLSISHCNTKGLSIAFPEHHPMGIDFEEIKTDNINSLQDQMTLDEVQYVKNKFPEEAKGCTLIWTAKEALSKVLKTGLMMDFKVLEIDKIEKKGLIWESTFKYCGQYKAISYCSDIYMYSLVLPKYSTLDISELVNVFKSLN